MNLNKKENLNKKNENIKIIKIFLYSPNQNLTNLKLKLPVSLGVVVKSSSLVKLLLKQTEGLGSFLTDSSERPPIGDAAFQDSDEKKNYETK